MDKLKDVVSDPEIMQDIQKAISEAASVEEIPMRIQQLFEGKMQEDLGGKIQQAAENIMREVGQKWKNPEDVTVPELVEFIMNRLHKEGIPGEMLSEIGQELSRYTTAEEVAMGFMRAVERYMGGNSSGGMGGAPPGFDPERMNEELMQRLPTMMEEIRQ
jgi:hypothetical protein